MNELWCRSFPVSASKIPPISPPPISTFPWTTASASVPIVPPKGAKLVRPPSRRRTAATPPPRGAPPTPLKPPAKNRSRAKRKRPHRPRGRWRVGLQDGRVPRRTRPLEALSAASCPRVALPKRLNAPPTETVLGVAAIVRTLLIEPAADRGRRPQHVPPVFVDGIDALPVAHEEAAACASERPERQVATELRVPGGIDPAVPSQTCEAHAGDVPATLAVGDRIFTRQEWCPRDVRADEPAVARVVAMQRAAAAEGDDRAVEAGRGRMRSG